MDRLIKLYLCSVFLVLIYSCSSTEIEEAAIMVAEEKTIDKNQDFISEIAKLEKKNKFFEEEILIIKNQLSEIKSLISEDNNIALTNDSERQAYQESFDLIRKGDYQAAQISFTSYIKTYQSSDFIDDAKFWLAQSMYSQGEYILALELFEAIQREYPNSEKIMESVLKAGFCHFELGNIDKSMEIFSQIIADYPNSSVARLASEKLNAIN